MNKETRRKRLLIQNLCPVSSSSSSSSAMQILKDRTADHMADLDTTTLENLFGMMPPELDQWLDEDQITAPGNKRKDFPWSDAERDSKVPKRKISMPRTMSKREESEQRNTYLNIHVKAAKSSITNTSPITTRSKAASLKKPIKAQSIGRLNSRQGLKPYAHLGEENDPLPLGDKPGLKPVNPMISSNHHGNALKRSPNRVDCNLNSCETDAKAPCYKSAKPNLSLGEIKENRGAHEGNIVKKVLIKVNSDEIARKETAMTKTECKKSWHHHKEDEEMRLHLKESDNMRAHHEENDNVRACHEKDDIMGMNPEENKEDKVRISHDDKMSLNEREKALNEWDIPRKEKDEGGYDVSRIQRLKRSASLMMSNVNKRVVKRLKCVHLARPSLRASVGFALCAIVTSISVVSYMYHLKKLKEQRARSRRWW